MALRSRKMRWILSGIAAMLAAGIAVFLLAHGQLLSLGYTEFPRDQLEKLIIADSGFKRLFGEVVSAKRFEQMAQEIQLKVWIYNLPNAGLECIPSPGPLRCGGLIGGVGV